MTSRKYPPPRTNEGPRLPAWARGPEWDTRRFSQPGWLLLPLRAFLGVTFTFAGLQKLANPDFLNASSPTSVQHQMGMLVHSSPIGPLVQLSLHAGAVTGVLIAVGELAVGIGALLGLQARLAAVGGSLLALTFFLTVSWNTTPYYYGADIVFLFAWTPFIAAGAAGVLSLDGLLASRRRQMLNRHADGRPVRDQELAGQYDAALRQERRAIITVGTATLLLGGFTALFGRMAHQGQPAATSPLKGSSTPSGHTPSHGQASHQPSASPNSSAPPPSGTKIGSTSAVPVGQAAQFTDPASGSPAWLVCLARGKYAAFSAICTHAGCTVQYDSNNTEFVCPCHGGVYSARTGQVLGGPPPSPLPTIPVQAANGQLYVD